MNSKPDILPPGTTLMVGSHQVSIIKYFSQGGFAQVYVAQIVSGPSSHGFGQVCLKRVLVPNKQSLNTLRAEVDCMKVLKGEKHIVTYIDSNASKSQSQHGVYEVFVLMEFCSRGGLIDFMNTRLQNRLTEKEVLSILGQTAQGVAAMHKLQPPLLHRDIKIENVLINDQGLYKLCDFGSVCGIIRPPKTQQEYEFVSHDVLSNTTAQYRAPEMIDLSKGLPIDEKSDIWALGVYLYKLCYYTTPFEKNGGDQAILKASYQFPQFPLYSDKLKNLIDCLLKENPFQRPNICQLLEEVSRLQGVPCPIENFYTQRSLNTANVPLLNSMGNIQQQQSQHKPMKMLLPTTSYTPTVAQQPVQIPLMADISQQPNYYPKQQLQQYSSSLGHQASQANVGASFNKQFKKSMTVDDPFSGLLTTARNDNKSAPSTTHNTGGLYALNQGVGSFSTVNSFNNAMSSFPGQANAKSSSKSDYDYKTLLQRTTSRSSKTSKAESFASNSSMGSSSSSEEENIYIKSYAARSAARSASTGSLNGQQLETVSTGGSFTKRLGNRLKKIVTGESFKSSSRQNTGNSMKSANVGAGVVYGNKNPSPVRRSSSRKTTPTADSGLVYNEERISRFKSDGGFSNKRKSMIIPDLDSPDKPDRDTDNGESIKHYYSHSRSSSPTKKASAKPTSSIQKRVTALLSDPATSANKSASGYGKYTDTGASSQGRSSSTIVTPIEEVTRNAELEIEELRKIVKNKKKKVPPTKPKKPAFLTSGKESKRDVRAPSSDLLNKDVDAMTTDFSKRFPSVL